MPPSGSERRAVLGALRRAWCAEALSIETFEFRVARVLAARSPAELEELVCDLETGGPGEVRLSLSADVAPYAVLGRGPGADVRLDDEAVSRRHAELVRRGTRVHVRDLGSTNGTELNGRPVADAEVRPGDRLRLGLSVVSFVP